MTAFGAVRASFLRTWLLWTAATLRALTASENAADLVVLTELVEAGKVTPVIDRSYPLGEAPAAIRHLVDGHARGKIVVTV